MAEKKVKVDPTKVKQADLKGVFSKVLDKLKSKQFFMKKIWIECQKCGSVFWIFSDEVKSVYPKSSINYQICSGCESRQLDK